MVDPDSRSTIGHYDGVWDHYKPVANVGAADGATFHPIEADFPLRKGCLYHESERGTTNAAMEGFNGKVRWLIKQAYGFKDFKYFRLKTFDLPSTDVRKRI